MRLIALVLLCCAPALAQRREVQQPVTVPMAAPPAPMAASVRNGAELWRRGEWAAAAAMWRPFAENGNLDAMFNIGQAYKLGRGLPKNEAQARDWYRKAAERGHRPAQANLGILLFQSGQKADALRWLKQAADAGEPRAQYVYGVAHWNGDGVPRSLVTAYAYLARAADQGLAEGRSAIDLLTPKMSVVERTSGWQLASALAKTDGSSGPLASIPSPSALAANAPVPQTPSSNPAAIAGKAATPTRPQPAFRVQLGAYSRRELAEAALAAIKSRSPALLEGVGPILQYDGSLTRLHIGTFDSLEASKAACARFTAAGYSCIPVDAP
ncbi:hypothetical protein GCM10007973_21430 [Polymorphobacter multimanifer]|nr:hypothetical protein GCM10007973_21430 [Polymorphobacter multimanifer]